MNAPLAMPPELRFACPHCRQRIACDPAYAGHPMICPTCQGGLQIPWGSGPGGELRLKPRETPASPEPLYPRPATEDFWTEAEWNQRLAADRRQKTKGFFTVQGQMYYAALYAITAFHVGILLGWKDPLELATAPFMSLFAGPGIVTRLPGTNASFWMLIAGAVLTGYAIARNPELMPFGLPFPSAPRRRSWWRMGESPKPASFGDAWGTVSLGVFCFEIFVCVLGGCTCALAKSAFTGW